MAPSPLRDKMALGQMVPALAWGGSVMGTHVNVARTGSENSTNRREAVSYSGQNLLLVKASATTTRRISTWPLHKDWRRVTVAVYTATVLWVVTFFGWWVALAWWQAMVELGGELHLLAPAMFSFLLYGLTAATFVSLLVWVGRFARVWASWAKARSKDREFVLAAAASAASASGRMNMEGTGEGAIGGTGVSTEVSTETMAQWVGLPRRSSWAGAWVVAACSLVFMVPLLVMSAMKFHVTSQAYAYPEPNPTPLPFSGLDAVFLSMLAVAAMALWAVLYRQQGKEHEREEE
jgi:hypothetical protein